METRFMISAILILIPSLLWFLMKQVHSPWWLENISSTPFTILPIYSVLMLVLISFLTLQQCSIYLLINLIVALCLNNSLSVNNRSCVDSERISFFQFNIKYQHGEVELKPVIEHLIDQKYHLIALQGVSQKSRKQLIDKLSPYFPYFISGGSEQQQVHSDQLLFSRYAFTNINYVKNGHSAFLITSQWQLPHNAINLYSLHPPSPRNEQLWQTRNRTLYQLKKGLQSSRRATSIVIGDLNISKHSKRMSSLTKQLNSTFVNSWPHKRYFWAPLGLAIDHFWVSKSANICLRERINDFSWSDHYAIKTEIDFK